MKAGKVWGSTEIVSQSQYYEVHILNIKPNSFCSMHRHNYKFNEFYVLSGELWIEVQKKAYALTDITHIKEGQKCSVPPGEFHKFFTKDQPCVCLEIYHLGSLSEDIERQTVGGTSIL